MKIRSTKFLAIVMAVSLMLSAIPASVAFGATTTPPIAPTLVKATSASYSSIKLSWQPVAGVAGYAVYRYNATTKLYAAIAVTATTSYVNTRLATGTFYYYKVRAYVMSGTQRVYGSLSAVVRAKPIPAATAKLVAVSTGVTSIKLSWTAVAGANGYGVYRYNPTTKLYAAIATTTTTSYVNTRLATGTNYYYKVRAYVMSGTQRVYGSLSAVVRVKPIPAATAKIAAVSTGATSIKLSWTAVAGANGYGVYRYNPTTKAYVGITTTASTSYTNVGLTTGSTYYYKVRAYRMVSTSRIYGYYSAIASAKPVARIVAPDYKGVVFYVDSQAFQMSPEAYTSNFGVKENNTGQVAMHYHYVWCENMGVNLTSQALKDEAAADKLIAPRYFRVPNLSKSEKIGTDADANFLSEINKGQAPRFVFGWDTVKGTPVDTKSLPLDTKKVLMVSWIDDYQYVKYITPPMNPLTSTPAHYKIQADRYVSLLAPRFAAVKAARNAATIYVTSEQLVGEAFPRFDKPNVLSRWGILYSHLNKVMKPVMMDVKFRNAINTSLKALCASKGYVYIDLARAGITNASGYTLERYAHPMGVGVQQNQAGLTKYGNYICQQMGLKTAVEMYGSN